MSRQEGKVVRPFEYSLEKSKLALEDKLIPELRKEIIHSELSPDKAWREAKRRLNNQDEALATSYWWLAKTKRDHKERLEKETNQEEKEMEKQNREISILVDGIKKVGQGHYGQLEAVFEFRTPEDVISAAVSFLMQIEQDESLVKIMVECVDSTPLVYNDFRMKLIQILEEKFGVKIKICMHCNSWRTVQEHRGAESHFCANNGCHRTYYNSCDKWIPKEVSEKKEEKQETPIWEDGHVFDGDPTSHVRPLRSKIGHHGGA